MRAAGGERGGGAGGGGGTDGRTGRGGGEPVRHVISCELEVSARGAEELLGGDCHLALFIDRQRKGE